VRPSDIQFEIHGLQYPSCESSEPKGDGMYWWTKAATVVLYCQSHRMSTVVRKGAGIGIVRIGSTNRQPNTAGPDFLLTHSQVSIEFPSNSSETPFSLVFSGFSGLGWLSLYRRSLLRREMSDSAWSATRLKWHNPRGSPLLNCIYLYLSEAYESNFFENTWLRPWPFWQHTLYVCRIDGHVLVCIEDGWRVCN